MQSDLQLNRSSATGKRKLHGSWAVLVWTVLLAISAVSSTHAAGIEWNFSKFGRLGFANFDGSWTVVRPLEVISASPEFTIPLELVYQSSSRDVGLFGPKWFCPQLESRILPGQNGILIWRMPSGAVVGLFPKRGSTMEFSDDTGVWMAKRTGNAVVIKNRDRWEFGYSAGQLQTITSPTKRILQIAYRANQPSQIFLKDGLSDVSMKVMDLDVGNSRLNGLTTSSGKFAFDYERVNSQRLLKFTRPGIAKPEVAVYSTKTSALESLNPASGEKVEFSVQIAKPGAPTRLVSDGTYAYTYTDLENPRNKGYVQIEDKAKARQSLSFEPKRGVLRVKDAAGIEMVTYLYRAPGQKFDGKLRRIERNGQLLVEHLYEPATGRLSQTKDANGQLTFYEYASLGPKPEESPLFDKPVQISQGNRKSKEVVQSFEYDSLGRVIQSKGREETSLASLKYTSRGELLSVTAADGKDQVLENDPLGRLKSLRKGELQEKLSYDDTTGKLRTRWLPDGQRVDYEYDSSGRNAAVKQNQVIVNQLSRDEMGRVTGSQDALGRETQLTLDARGNVITEKQPNGVLNRYEYDSKGKRTAQIDGNGNKVVFKYDDAGRLIEQVNAIGQKLTWSFDSDGRLTQRTNGEQIVEYAYDSKGRLKVISYGELGEKLVHDYDPKGQLIRVASPTIELKLHRDSQGRILAKEFISRGKERVIRYEYTAKGQKKSVVLSERKTGEEEYRLLHQTEYGYDAQGRLAVLKANNRHICSYRYDAAGRLIQRSYGNGIEGRYGYDKFGRMTLLELKGGPLVEPMLLAYEWDAAGQVTRRAWNKDMQQYSYDGAGQLVTVRSTALTDQSKTLLMAASSIPQVLALPIGETVEAYNYDPAGNITKKFEYGETTQMNYDAGNQLVSTLGTGSASFQTSTFVYDQAGRQTQIVASSTATRRTYGWLDKVIELDLPDGRKLGLDYYPDGQLAVRGPLPAELPKAVAAAPVKPMDFLKRLLDAKAGEAAKLDESLESSPAQLALEPTEEYVWDDLALLWRSGMGYAMEPHPNGGTPVATFERPDAPPTFLLSDILGTTLAAVKPDRVEVIPLTAFGKPLKGRATSNSADIGPLISPLSDNSEKKMSSSILPQAIKPN